MVIAVRNVLAALAKRRWTQAELARRLDTNPGCVSRWLAGDQIPTIYSAVRMAKLLGVAVSDWAFEDRSSAPLPVLDSSQRRPGKGIHHPRKRRPRRRTIATAA